MYRPDTDSKGYKAARKLIEKLKGQIYPGLDYEDENEFRKAMIEHLLPMGIKMPEELINY